MARIELLKKKKKPVLDDEDKSQNSTPDIQYLKMEMMKGDNSNKKFSRVGIGSMNNNFMSAT